jgi:hypothetical protein
MIIRTGHYQTKASLGSDKPDIIRILGVDKEKTDAWKTADGRSIPSYIIEEDYVFLDTRPSAKAPQNIPPKSIFSDFKPIEESAVIPVIAVDSSNLLPNNPEIKHSGLNTFPIEENQIQINFDIAVLDKINIDVLNQKYFERHGVNKYVKPTLNITVPLTLDYDIQKLKSTIELLDLDENVVFNYLVNNLSVDINQLIKTQLMILLKSDELTPFVNVAISENEKKIKPETEDVKFLSTKIEINKLPDNLNETIPVKLPNGNVTIGTFEQKGDGIYLTCRVSKLDVDKLFRQDNLSISSRKVEEIKTEPIKTEEIKSEEPTLDISAEIDSVAEYIKKNIL